jgi:predicted nucleic acid-binding Zn ribbon protein
VKRIVFGYGCEMPGRSKPLSRVSEVLKGAIQKWNLGSSLHRYQLMAEWESIAGAPLAAKSRPLRFQGELLFVEVDHPAWVQELNLFKSNFLSKIAKSFPQAKIKRIHFVLKK